VKNQEFSLSPALSTLAPLKGDWIVEITWSAETHKLVGGPPTVRGSGTFDWTCSGGFLVHSTGGDGAPRAYWTIGRDDTSALFKALYADDRGVSRIYEMSFSDDVWKLWRDAPGFHQRFEGHLSSDQQIVEARWEKSCDGVVWERDFDIVYLKRGRAEGSFKPDGSL
jgi:hypothetical protein